MKLLVRKVIGATSVIQTALERMTWLLTIMGGNTRLRFDYTRNLLGLDRSDQFFWFLSHSKEPLCLLQ